MESPVAEGGSRADGPRDDAGSRPRRHRVGHQGAAGNRRGVLYLVAAMVCLLLNDTLMKLSGQALPVPQMVFIRGLFALALVLVAAALAGALVQARHLVDRPVMARAAVDAVGTLLYLVSLMHLPLANATAINLAAPLMMAALAVPLLHEHASLRRWLAIALGFAGVLLVIQPRADGFNGWSLVCLGGTFCHSLRELLTRRVDRAVPSIVITLASTVAVLLLAALATALQGWQPVLPRQVATLALAGALLACGYFFMVNSMRHGEMTVVAPFRYTGLLMALLLGWGVWGEVPNALAWAGIALLLATGMSLLHEGRTRADAA